MEWPTNTTVRVSGAVYDRLGVTIRLTDTPSQVQAGVTWIMRLFPNIGYSAVAPLRPEDDSLYSTITDNLHLYGRMLHNLHNGLFRTSERHLQAFH